MNKNQWYNNLVAFINSTRVYIRLKCVYSVISVIEKRLSAILQSGQLLVRGRSECDFSILGGGTLN